MKKAYYLRDAVTLMVSNRSLFYFIITYNFPTSKKEAQKAPAPGRVYERLNILVLVNNEATEMPHTIIRIPSSPINFIGDSCSSLVSF